MKIPLVRPMPTVGNPELEELVKYFNETLGFCPNSVLTMQHRPEIAKAFVNLNMAVMKNDGRLSCLAFSTGGMILWEQNWKVQRWNREIFI